MIFKQKFSVLRGCLHEYYKKHSHLPNKMRKGVAEIHSLRPSQWVLLLCVFLQPSTLMLLLSVMLDHASGLCYGMEAKDVIPHYKIRH